MAGLEAAGYRACTAMRTPIEPDDIVLAWNRYGHGEQVCEQFEAAGARAVIAENGYLNPGGGNPKFDAHEGRPGYYALALHQHNGAGWFPSGGPERWDALGIKLKPWRVGGEHILVCPNRLFGSRAMMPPTGWAEDVAKRLRASTGREVRIRAHPGNKRPGRTLEQDLEGCGGMVIWASSAGLQALIEGIPVVCEAPHWICREATNWDCGIDFSWMACWLDRRGPFERLAHAQWTVDEISSGEPFRRLLQTERIAA